MPLVFFYTPSGFLMVLRGYKDHTIGSCDMKWVEVNVFIMRGRSKSYALERKKHFEERL